VIAGLVSYMLLCWGGFAGLVSLTSPYSSELLVLSGGFVCLQGFAMCACAKAWRIWFSVGERTSV
jgi:hypothetical protein